MQKVNQFEDQNQIYTHNMHVVFPWASHNKFFRTLEFDVAAVSVKRPIIDVNEALLVDSVAMMSGRCPCRESEGY